MTVEEYRKLRARGTEKMYAHCGNCLSDKPDGLPPSEWSQIEAIMDLKTGVLTIGCVRCEMPIVSALLAPALVEHLVSGGCAACKKEGGNNGDH